MCAPLASSTPGNHMQSREPRLAPSVGLMPSLSPEQPAPTSLIILAGIMQEHTNHAWTDARRHAWLETDTRDRAEVYHTKEKWPKLGR